MSIDYRHVKCGVDISGTINEIVKSGLMVISPASTAELIFLFFMNID